MHPTKFWFILTCHSEADVVWQGTKNKEEGISNNEQGISNKEQGISNKEQGISNKEQVTMKK